jgi:hypothetical protein
MLNGIIRRAQLAERRVAPPFIPCTSSPCSVVNFPDVPDNSPADVDYLDDPKVTKRSERRNLCILQCLENFDRQFTSEPAMLTPDDA